MSNIQWRPTIKKWYNINKDAYELIFSQAKERFEDILSESESITNKSIKLLTAVTALFGFIVGFLIQKKLSIGFYTVFSIFYFAAGILLFLLIAPKEIRNRGISPQSSIPSNLDDPEDRNYQVEMIYYQSIIIIQDNIGYMIEKNTNRVRLYQWALIVFMVLLASAGTLVILLL